MCKFCENSNCTLTKQQALEHGAIIEDNVYHIMRVATDSTPNTYSFKDIPCYDSLSSLIPVENDENPHVYIRFIYDEDEDCEKGWETDEIQNPLKWQTEKEFLEKVN